MFADDPAPIVSHVRPAAPGRRMRMAVVSGGVLAILAGLGVGYAALSGSGPDPVAAPGATATATPADGVLDLEPALPGIDPVTGATTSPAGTTAPAVARTPAAAATTTAGHTATQPVRTTRPVLPGVPDQPADTVAPSSPAQPAPTQPAAPLLLPAVATLTFTADEGEQGWTGYAGQVRVENPGSTATRSWQVTLTVPGGNKVDASGASVSQDGDSVTFTGGPIAARDSLTFTFTVDGTLTELPGGCRIDGNACS
ncbi:cellulose binding domain-containing protein [Actinoplanes sp. NPDC049316]|uniref:cellulose binding domain-containing protein n=1 Tax=Actinoplanes sp. NPDC049316 TaxID=3154727 RepID=UPI00343F53F5